MFNKQQCRNPVPSSLCRNKGPTLWPGPQTIVYQRYCSLKCSFVYLALIAFLKVLPWHVSTGCCWPTHRRTAEEHSGSHSQAESSCMWGRFNAAEQHEPQTWEEWEGLPLSIFTWRTLSFKPLLNFSFCSFNFTQKFLCNKRRNLLIKSYISLFLCINNSLNLLLQFSLLFQM